MRAPSRPRTEPSFAGKAGASFEAAGPQFTAWEPSRRMRGHVPRRRWGSRTGWMTPLSLFTRAPPTPSTLGPTCSCCRRDGLRRWTRGAGFWDRRRRQHRPQRAPPLGHALQGWWALRTQTRTTRSMSSMGGIPRQRDRHPHGLLLHGSDPHHGLLRLSGPESPSAGRLNLSRN